MAKFNDQRTKVWIALFTCLNTRALYVDIATSFSASCFPNVLHRFIASNGCPRGILSDNAPVFVSVVTMLSPLLTEDDQNLFDYSSRLNIPFKFVPALAPWQSGIYERMVKIFKPSFKAAIRSRKIELGEFHPLIKECEAFLNSRPLTYVYNIIDSDRISIMTNRLPPTVRSPSSPDFNKNTTLTTNG